MKERRDRRSLARLCAASFICFLGGGILLTIFPWGAQPYEKQDAPHVRAEPRINQALQGSGAEQFIHAAGERAPQPDDTAKREQPDDAVAQFVEAAYEGAELPPSSPGRRAAMEAMAEAMRRFGDLDESQRQDVAEAWSAFAATVEGAGS